MEKKKMNLWKKFLIVMAIVLIAFIIFEVVEFVKKTNEKEVDIDNTNYQVDSNKAEEKEDIYLYGEEIKSLVKKFNFAGSTSGSIYKTGGFDINNIPNDLILRMAWRRLDAEKDTTIKRTGNEGTQTVNDTVLEKSVKNLFGNNITYQNESFEYIDSKTFESYEANTGKILYKDGVYTSKYKEEGGEGKPYIYEVAEKALKKDNKIELYVKTAFIKPGYDEEIGDFVNDCYSDFDFEKEDFVNKIKTVKESEFFKDVYEYANDSLGTILINNPIFNEMKEQLNTYVYTFEKDENTGDYYIVSFNKVEDKNKSTSMSEKNIEKAKKEKVLGKYLSIYVLRDCIQTPAYEILNLPNMNENPTITKETILINGEEYDLYKTKTKFEDYKKAMLNYVTEEIFEQSFTTYQKDINGILHMVLNAGDGKNYEIVDMTEISDNTYEVKCNYYQGENPAITEKFIVEFEKSGDSYIIKKCSKKILEDVEYIEVTVEDKESTKRTSI